MELSERGRSQRGSRRGTVAEGLSQRSSRGRALAEELSQTGLSRMGSRRWALHKHSLTDRLSWMGCRARAAYEGNSHCWTTKAHRAQYSNSSSVFSKIPKLVASPPPSIFGQFAIRAHEENK